MNDAEFRRCSRCNQVKPLSDFCKAKHCSNGYSRLCKKCHSKDNKKWRNNKSGYHLSSIRHSNLLQQSYKISEEFYNYLLKQQNGVCAICGKKEVRKNPYNKKPRRLAVDHSHKTGKVRGLLCSNCNNALGFAKDSISLLQKMIDYLIRNT